MKLTIEVYNTNLNKCTCKKRLIHISNIIKIDGRSDCLCHRTTPSVQGFIKGH